MATTSIILSKFVQAIPAGGWVELGRINVAAYDKIRVVGVQRPSQRPTNIEVYLSQGAENLAVLFTMRLRPEASASIAMDLPGTELAFYCDNEASDQVATIDLYVFGR